MKAVGMLISSLPYLIIRFGAIYLGYKRKSKKAGKIFKKTLLKEGIDRRTADKLTNNFTQTIGFKEFIGWKKQRNLQI